MLNGIRYSEYLRYLNENVTNPILKAISIKNPWADLIVKGIKDIENRSWRTSYDGPIFIHISKAIDINAYNILSKTHPTLIESKEYYNNQNGKIIGSFFIKNFNNSTSEWADKNSLHWNLENVLKFDNYFQVKGSLSIWTIPFEIRESLLNQIKKQTEVLLHVRC
jgi:hypothetical protein